MLFKKIVYTNAVLLFTFLSVCVYLLNPESSHSTQTNNKQLGNTKSVVNSNTDLTNNDLKNTNYIAPPPTQIPRKGVSPTAYWGKKIKAPGWMAVIADNNDIPLCSGILVSRIYVATAAHCLLTRTRRPDKKQRLRGPRQVRVSLGSNNIFKWRQKWHRVAKVMLPGKRKFMSVPNPDRDFALLRLKHYVKRKPVKITAAGSILPKTNLYSYGYGAYANNSDMSRMPRRLRGVVPDEDNAYYFYNSLVSSSWDGSICYGDSGGPAITYVNKTPVLLGLLSRGEMPCGKKNPYNMGIFAELGQEKTQTWLRNRLPQYRFSKINPEQYYQVTKYCHTDYYANVSLSSTQELLKEAGCSDKVIMFYPIEGQEEIEVEPEFNIANPCISDMTYPGQEIVIWHRSAKSYLPYGQVVTLYVATCPTASEE